MNDVPLKTALTMPADFRFGEVPSLPRAQGFAAAAATTVPTTPVASLGPLAAFTGTFHGSGFNTIFRPDNSVTPTPLPVPVAGSDNILELNVTEETLAFSAPLGAVPNRGEVQGDINLNGVPYLQTIKDVTNPGQSVGIHFEPGLWMAVPSTTDPAEGATVVRMASIPHGTTIVAQGTSFTVPGGPRIAPIDITPFADQGGGKIPFPSQTATATGTARIPQDLAPFIKAGTITDAILSNPAILLTNHIAGQNILSTDVITISTSPATPLFGGGTSNIAFLLGNSDATVPNANATKMEAIFWIETVEYTIEVPAFSAGTTVVIAVDPGPGGGPAPSFQVDVPPSVTDACTIKATATQIQYAQQVFLDFNGLTWPHVSVANLVPADPVPVPATAFA